MKTIENNIAPSLDAIRKNSLLFGYIAVKKGYATSEQVKDALLKQESIFRTKQGKKMVGDMLVESGILTKDQQQIILKEQLALIAQKGSKSGDTVEEEKKEPEENQAINVTLSEDKMEAWIKILPPPPLNSNGSENLDDQEEKLLEKKKQKPITLILIKSELRKKGVVNGILSDAILQSHIDRKDDLFLAAVGEYKCSQRAEYQLGDIVRNIGDSDNLPTVSDSTIKRDKTLAQVKSANIEIKLIDIFGKISQLKDGDSSFLLRCGCWVALSEDGLRAVSVQSGYPALSIESKLYIFPVVNVIADADIRFGQIDPYASLNVSGVLTGAYPVNAGQIKAVEIRGATVSSIGDISVDVGIIGSKIKTQGSVRAKYIHNSRIEAFGDVFVEHEIIDSTIIISGECNVSAGRVVASKIFAKMGVKATRIGSNITEPCYINVGCEEHIALKLIEINRQINKAQKELDDLILEKEAISQSIKELFKKMVKIKGSYDQVKSNFVKLSQEINIDSQE
ncbi:MAG: DUF342 domain-containing protein, partial [Desulfamplus sp.]|nr:DUF342 domain-containing protein [Desulfamplus sp.]